METQEVKEYILKLPESVTAQFNALEGPEQDKQIFAASEFLGDHYTAKRLTPRAVALQVLFSLEAEGEEFARLKRHGVESMSTKGTSVTFSRADSISPAVISILGEPIKKGSIGRLV